MYTAVGTVQQPVMFLQHALASFLNCDIGISLLTTARKYIVAIPKVNVQILTVIFDFTAL